MPWFLTSISTGKDSIENPTLTIRTRRTFGFFNSHKEAYDAVMENRCNMVECLYDYHVMEYIESGIHPMVHVEEWFKYDEAKNGWVPCEKPEDFVNVVNWALG